MHFYDLKTVVGSDLSPVFFLGKAESGDIAVKCCTAWLDSVLYKYKMKIAQELVLKPETLYPGKEKKTSTPSLH